MSRFYSDDSREDDPWSLPDVEVFYLTAGDFLAASSDTWMADLIADAGETEDDRADRALELSGWYYWFCFPGCLPDSDAIGPFKTEAEAIEDARSNV